MATAISIACGNVTNGGDIRAKVDAVHISCDEAPVWNTDGTQKRLRFRLTPPSGAESATWSGYSELFAPNADGQHTWEGYVFPAAGSWTVRLHDEEADSDLATLAVTVV